MMLRLQEQGYHTLTQFGGRAFTYISNFVMQTAIKVGKRLDVGGGIVNIKNIALLSNNLVIPTTER